MPSIAFAVPIREGKLALWKSYKDEMIKREAAFQESAKRRTLTRQMSFFQETPMGQFSIVFQEGEDPKQFSNWDMDNEWDAFFLNWVMEVHGLDLTQPMGPPSSLETSWEA